LGRSTVQALAALVLLAGLAACSSNEGQPEEQAGGGSPTAVSATSAAGETAAPNATPAPASALSYYSTTPVEVSGLGGNAVSIAVGYWHTCALLGDGSVKCWGRNLLGQLGNGTVTDSATPVDVLGLGEKAAAVVAGNRHTCALLTTGGVKCWGSNYHGQIGDDTRVHRVKPVDVTGLESGVVAITAGEEYVCALTTAGGAKCWGDNTVGELGDGTAEHRGTPVDVLGLGSGVTAIDGGQLHTCAVTEAGGVECWGENNRGQLGNEKNTKFSDVNAVPVDVVGLQTGVVDVAAGRLHTCALKTDGSVACWGWNSDGQLGDGTKTWSVAPVNVIGLEEGAVAIAAGRYHTCVVTTKGGMKCWGDNNFGELGDGTTTDRSTPVEVKGLDGDVAAIGARGGRTCAVMTSGEVKCWGRDASSG
jgi:alpha-tubulin suppressor-like RCC1 family protein